MDRIERLTGGLLLPDTQQGICEPVEDALFGLVTAPPGPVRDDALSVLGSVRDGNYLREVAIETRLDAVGSLPALAPLRASHMQQRQHVNCVDLPPEHIWTRAAVLGLYGMRRDVVPQQVDHWSMLDAATSTSDAALAMSGAAVAATLTQALRWRFPLDTFIEMLTSSCSIGHPDSQRWLAWRSRIPDFDAAFRNLSNIVTGSDERGHGLRLTLRAFRQHTDADRVTEALTQQRPAAVPLARCLHGALAGGLSVDLDLLPLSVAQWLDLTSPGDKDDVLR